MNRIFFHTENGNLIKVEVLHSFNKILIYPMSKKEAQTTMLLMANKQYNKSYDWYEIEEDSEIELLATSYLDWDMIEDTRFILSNEYLEEVDITEQGFSFSLVWNNKLLKDFEFDKETRLDYLEESIGEDVADDIRKVVYHG